MYEEIDRLRGLYTVTIKFALFSVYAQALMFNSKHEYIAKSSLEVFPLLAQLLLNKKEKKKETKIILAEE